LHQSDFWNLVPQQGLVWSKSAGFRTIFSFWNHVVYQTVCYGFQRISLDGWILCVPMSYNKLMSIIPACSLRLMQFYSISGRHLIKSYTRDWQRNYITMESVVTPCHGLKVSWQTENSR
jgi:hypothetical protein